MEYKKLGKIISIKFGLVGYQNAQFGLSVTLGNKDWGVTAEKCYWDYNVIKCDEHCKWSDDDREKANDSLIRFISDLLRDAKVDSLAKLQGKPVEVIFNNKNALKEWSILTECI